MTPWSKRLAILLAVSIGLNLLLAGVLIGRGFARPHGGPWPRGGPREHAHAGAEWREARRHPLLRDAIGQRRGELKARRDAIMAARNKVREALGRDVFDRAALDGALANLRAETVRSQELLHGALIDGAGKATPEQRRELMQHWDAKERGKR